MNAVVLRIDKRQPSMLQTVQVGLDDLHRLDPMRGLQEAMKVVQLQNPLRELREMMQGFQFQDPMRGVREAVKGIQLQDRQHGLREAILEAQFQDPMREIRNEMKSIHLQDSLRDLREAVQGIWSQVPMRGIREVLQRPRWQDPMAGIRALANAAALGAAESQAWLGAALEADSLVDGEDIAEEELEPAKRRQLVDAIAGLIASTPEHIASAVQTLVSEIRSLKESRNQQILWMFVVPLLVGLLTTTANTIVGNYTDAPREQAGSVRALEVVIKVASSNRVETSAVRIVWARTAWIRSSARKGSPTVGVARRGQVVVLLLKRKRWSLVGFFDEVSGSRGYGWILSKNLNQVR